MIYRTPKAYQLNRLIPTFNSSYFAVYVYKEEYSSAIGRYVQRDGNAEEIPITFTRYSILTQMQRRTILVVNPEFNEVTAINLTNRQSRQYSFQFASRDLGVYTF